MRKRVIQTLAIVFTMASMLTTPIMSYAKENSSNKVIKMEDEVVGLYDATKAWNFTDMVPIDEEHFPDAAFRQYVSEKFDTNNGYPDDEGRISKEGWLSYFELASALSINCEYDYDYMKEVESLKGIEYFENLEYFKLKGCHKLKGTLDLSSFENLKEFAYTYTGNVGELDGYSEVKLPEGVESVGIQGSKISKINIPTSVKSLDIQDAEITELNIPSSVKYLNVRNSKLALEGKVVLPEGIEEFYGWEDMPMEDYTKYPNLKEMGLDTLDDAKETYKEDILPTPRRYDGFVIRNQMATRSVYPKKYLDLEKHGFKLDKIISCEDGSIENGILYPRYVDTLGYYVDTATIIYDFGIDSEYRYQKIRFLFENEKRPEFYYSENSSGDVIPKENTSPNPEDPNNQDPDEITPTPTPSEPSQTPSTGLTFKDVEEGKWYTEHIKWVCEKGIMNGYNTDTFGVNDSLTREQFATMLHRAAGKEATSFSNSYTDVKAGTWYTEAVNWCSEKGIVTGYSNGSFGTGDSIERQQLATMLYRYAKVKGLNVSGTSSLSGFADESNISEYAKEALSWCVSEGILTGKSSGGKLYLDPKGTATRAECATMLSRFLQ